MAARGCWVSCNVQKWEVDKALMNVLATWSLLEVIRTFSNCYGIDHEKNESPV